MTSFLRGGLHLPSRVVAAGEVIIQQGDRGDSAYMIVEGSCRVTQTRGEREIELGLLGPGEVFGELAVLLDDVRTATVVAAQATTLLVIDRAALQGAGMMEGWSSALFGALAQRFRTLEQKVRGD